MGEPKDFEEESTAESEALQVASEQKKKLMEEKAKLAKERLAEKHAEKQKHEGLPGIFRAARPGWNDHAIELSVKTVTKAGADSVATLRAMLEKDGELNRMLVAAGEQEFNDDYLHKLREQCRKSLAA